MKMSRTTLQAKRSEARISVEERYLSETFILRLSLGLTQSPMKWVPGFISRGKLAAA